MTALRVAVVGARRRRAGLGRFLARFLVRHGAELVGVVGTTERTVAEALAGLRDDGLDTRGYTDLDALVAAERPHAVVIASPAVTHSGLLDRALAHGLHTLCEKPLVWDTRDDPATAARHQRAFAAAGLVLVENVIWPYTLPAFEALHPGALGRPPERFEMWLSPSRSGGAWMLRESLSHPVALLQALVPGAEPTVEDVEFSTDDPGSGTLGLRFGFRCGEVRVEASVALDTVATQPRPAGYALDGRRAERAVRRSDYALSFRDGGRKVPVPDPMERLVVDFVRAARTGDEVAYPCVSRGVADRARLLTTLHAAFLATTPTEHS